VEWVALVIAVLALVISVALAVRAARQGSRVERQLADAVSALRARDDAARVVAARTEAALEAARHEATRAETARVEAERRQTEFLEVARAETARFETARAESARLEALRAEGARQGSSPAVPAATWKLSTSGNRFTFRNVSPDDLSDVALEQTNGDVLTAEQPMPVSSLKPGEEIVFVAHWKYSSPATAQVAITWHVGTGLRQQHTATLV
jgi:hypothetical protein